MDLLARFGASLSYIYLEANAAADSLASLHLTGYQLYLSMADLPKQCRDIIMLDSKGLPYCRLVRK